MTPLDPDRTLALAYVPAGRRAAVEALWRLDAALGAAIATGREPLISQIKLAWWREALAKLDRERAPAEPVLQALAAHVLPAGVTGAALSEMEQGWAALLNEHALESDDFDLYAARGRLLFRHSATLLGGRSDAALERSGEAWALVDLARHSGEPDASAALAAARERGAAARWPSALRPLGMLAALAWRDAAGSVGDLEPQGAPRRMLRMLGHRLTGK
ncbi:squalene/phytoene synthase family protein [Sphingomonas sp. LY54]|uniref:squalene/phytoene synthase family protein n=1 Tax=Sphingomonas sp. LY54 TaxID=3095343 RepID=UPI002D794054|nr:squalene/phytoene synthase family protein [Sphingomonas sp. LY54]WRP28912.1 squalene/phytoene synthase family protein [Sphingomonas sp. LY54]